MAPVTRSHNHSHWALHLSLILHYSLLYKGAGGTPHRHRSSARLIRTTIITTTPQRKLTQTQLQLGRVPPAVLQALSTAYSDQGAYVIG